MNNGDVKKMLESILGKTLTPLFKNAMFTWDDGTRAPSTAPMILPESPGQLFIGSYDGLNERIDTTHGTPHLNYDLNGATARYTQKALDNNHRVDLYKP